jgi:hypothetical protein
MRLQEAIVALFTAGALAAPAPLHVERLAASVLPRDVPAVVPTMNVNWTRYNDKPFETLTPVASDDNITLSKRDNKFNLQNSVTLSWKSRG